MVNVRQTGVKTRYPGVTRVSDRTYRLRAKVRDPRTGLLREIDRLVEASTVKDAAHERDRLVAEIKLQTQTSARVRLRDYAESWLTSRLPRLKVATRRSYANTLGHHIVPVLGNYFLDAIRMEDVIKWRDDLLTRHKPASVNHHLFTFKVLMKDAVHDHNLPRDPAARVATVRWTRSEDDPNSLTTNELGRFLKAASELAPQHYPLIATLALTGLRFGEATALKWSDIDLDAGAIHIRRAQWKGHLGTTKTGKARVVPLHPVLANVLRKHRQDLVARQHVSLAEGWCFLNTVGRLAHVTMLSKAFIACRKAAGIDKRLSVHGLRRTFNNGLRRVAQDHVVVRAVIGHSTPEMTEHYSTVTLAEKQHAVAALVRLLPGDGSGDRGGDARGSQSEDVG